MLFNSARRCRSGHSFMSIAVVVLIAMAAPSARGATDDGELRHVHASGRYDVPRRVLEKDLDRLMAVSDLVTTTEMHNRQRASALRESGWQRFWQPGRLAGECGMSWRADEWKLVTGTTARLTRKTFRTAANDGRKRVGYAATVVLRSVATGRTVLVSVAHMPSNVESADGRHWSHESRARVNAYKDAMRGWREHVHSMITAQAPDVVLVTGDWNLDLKRGWARRWLRGQWRGQGVTNLDWKAPYPRGGTLVDHRFGRTRKRLIDATFISGGSYAWAGHLHHDVASSDHNPYRETIALP
jgi:hypothetical protein